MRKDWKGEEMGWCVGNEMLAGRGQLKTAKGKQGLDVWE